MSNRLTSLRRQRRNTRDFERALRNASPSMHQELIAAATRQQFLR